MFSRSFKESGSKLFKNNKKRNKILSSKQNDKKFLTFSPSKNIRKNTISLCESIDKKDRKDHFSSTKLIRAKLGGIPLRDSI
jgi:hypothetical protein